MKDLNQPESAQNGNLSPIRRMKTRHSNLSEKHAFMHEDIDKINFLQKSSTILDQLNVLEKRNLQLQQELEQKDKTIQLMNERQASLLQEKAKLEEVLDQVDEVGKHSEFEEYQEQLKNKFEENLNKETEEMRMRIGELEHMLLTKDVKLREAAALNTKLKKEVADKVEIVQNYEENFVPRAKYENEANELKKWKLKVSKLEDTVTFRDMKIGELETKVTKSEEARRKELDKFKKKSDEKYEETRRKWDDRHQKLKEQLKELTQWKNQNLLGQTVDVAQV